MTSLLRRSVIPLAGLGLIAVVVLVALLVLGTGDSPGTSDSLPVIHIGISSAAKGEAGTASSASATEPTLQRPVSEASQGQGTGAAQGATNDGGAGPPTVRSGGTTVVTAGIRVQPGPKYQGGSTGTSGTHGSGSTGSPGR